MDLLPKILSSICNIKMVETADSSVSPALKTVQDIPKFIYSIGYMHFR